MLLFSIIIPTYNSSLSIANALTSLLQQTFTDFEVLVMDGLSKDNTVAIAEQFADKRVKIYSGKDSGVYDAMNKGISKACGEWILFLGSDDKLHTDFVLENVLNHILQSKDVDVFYGNVISPIFNGVYGGAFTIERILYQNICHQSIFFNQKVFKRVGKFNLRFKILADWEHNFRWFLSKEVSVKYINLVIADYADGGMSSTSVDWLFMNEKSLLFLLCGRNSLSLDTKIKIVKMELIRAVKNKDMKKGYLMIRYFPLLVLRILFDRR